MGYRYGEHKYSEGRYSRWPDWWHQKECVASGWQGIACDAPVWVPADKRKSPWTPSPAVFKPNLRRRNVERR